MKENDWTYQDAMQCLPVKHSTLQWYNDSPQDVSPLTTESPFVAGSFGGNVSAYFVTGFCYVRRWGEVFWAYLA